MGRIGEWVTERWPHLVVGAFAILFVCTVGYYLQLAAICTGVSKILLAIAVVLILHWFFLRYTDGEAMSRVVSGPMQVEREDKKFGRRLLRPLVVKGLSGKRITVHSGFRTDYSSIPSPFRPLVHWSKVDVAGVVHDYLYRTQQFSRATDDRIWWLLARSGKWRADPIQAWLCWIALRGFG